MNRTILMVQLWDKVKTLLSEKLTVAQVSRILGIDRKTVRKYRDMSQEQISVVNSEHTHPEKRPPFRSISTQNASIFIEKGVRIREIAQVFRSNATQHLSIAF